jgi:hypothetical protein
MNPHVGHGWSKMKAAYLTLIGVFFLSKQHSTKGYMDEYRDRYTRKKDQN